MLARALLMGSPVKLTVHLRSSPATGAIQAFCPDLPGCAASAPTEAEALDVLRRRVSELMARSARRAPVGTRVQILEV